MKVFRKSLRRRGIQAATAILLMLSLAGAASAHSASRGRGGSHGGGSRVSFVSSPFWGGSWGSVYYWYSPYYGLGPFGWGNLPLARGGERGLYKNVARALDLGALDLRVRPSKTDVYVDGEYFGHAGDFSGYTPLWIAAGEHTLTLYKGGYQTHEQIISVGKGTVQEVRMKLLPGASEPPSPSN